MALTGILQVDGLLSGQTSGPLGPHDGEHETVGLIQDLLRGHGFKDLAGPGHGNFGQRTTDAVRQFQNDQHLPVTGAIDVAMLKALIETPALRPIACCGYLALVLDIVFEGMVRVMSLTSQFEGAGLFTAMNRNTDKAGLSFGLIQWAQKPGRLNGLLRAFQSKQPAVFVQIFGGGDEALAQGLIAHTARSRGGTDDSGQTVDQRFDLIREPWDGRFIEAGRNRELQRAQVETAVADFGKSFAKLGVFAPQIRSERGIAFMLDVANQHGDGGAESIFKKVQKPGLSEADLLVAVQQESVARVRAQFGDGPEVLSTNNRREAFRTSPALSDQPVVLA